MFYKGTIAIFTISFYCQILVGRDRGGGEMERERCKQEVEVEATVYSEIVANIHTENNFCD